MHRCWNNVVSKIRSSLDNALDIDLIGWWCPHGRLIKKFGWAINFTIKDNYQYDTIITKWKSKWVLMRPTLGTVTFGIIGFIRPLWSTSMHFPQITKLTFKIRQKLFSNSVNCKISKEGELQKNSNYKFRLWSHFETHQSTLLCESIT